MSKTFLEALTSVGKNLQSGIDKLDNTKIDINVMEITGVKGDGINDDGSLITNFITTSNYSQLCLYFPPSKVFLGDITISRSNVNLTGKGTINGTLYITFNTPTYANIKIHDVIIKPYLTNVAISSKINSCVLLTNVRNIHFHNVDFFYGFAGIRIAENATKKHSGCMTINACTFNHCVYDLYCYDSNYQDYLAMDTAITNCQMYSTKVTSIYCKGFDGLMVKGNTLFTAGYQVKEKEKKNNIYINQGNFVVIEGNNLFEAGEDSIVIENVSNFNIVNNNIAWAGEVKLSAGILIKGSITSKTDSEALMRGNISNNTIDNATMYGISVTGYVQGINICNNAILLNTGTYYYGSETYSTENLRAIRIDPNYGNGCSILICNNNYYNNYDEIGNYHNVKLLNNLSVDGVINNGFSVVSMTDGQWGNTTLNYTSNNTFSKNDKIIIPIERTKDLSIISIGGDVKENKEIMIINNNENIRVTIKHNSTSTYPFYTSLGQDLVMSPHSIAKFIFMNNAWYQV